jgi:G-protein coupled receptor 98
VIGPDDNLEVNILSNGNPYGRIEFAVASAYIVVEERSRDWALHLEVLREQGNYGEVIVAWNSTGNVSESGSHGDDDVYPASGEIVFMEGETRKTINLTIFADDVPEVNEVFQVR